MSKKKFKIGDRVRRTVPSANAEEFGEVGREYEVQFVTPWNDIVILDQAPAANSEYFELVSSIPDNSPGGFIYMPPSTGGHKQDAGKLPMELISPLALEGIAAVLQFGAKKYAPNNWRKGLSWSRILGAIFRHFKDLLKGIDIDEESGLPTVDHLACEIMFLQEFYRTRKDLDDRYKVNMKGNG